MLIHFYFRERPAQGPWNEIKEASMSNIETLTQHSLAAARSVPGILVIDFWAPWCGPCGSMAPQFERAAELRPQYRFAKVNVDEQPTVASVFGVRSIPTLVVIADGEVISASPGVIGAEQLVTALDELAPASSPHPVLQEGALR
jgi:thioredoxin